MRTGITNLPLHYGKAPKWLFERMVKLSKAITIVIVNEYGQKEFLKRLSDPFWFQAFGCVLGFDWHSSGLTTTVLGALKEGMKENDFGIGVCGGKGKTSRKTLEEIEKMGDRFSLSDKKINELKYSSKMSAKIDNTALQDGYNLYHHSFIFTERGYWCVIQQGLNPQNQYARRYHWLSDDIKSFVDEPHKAICCDKKEKGVLNMVAKESEEARRISVDLVKENPEKINKFFNNQTCLQEFFGHRIKKLHMPSSHFIINMKKINLVTLQKAYEIQPKNYEELLSIKGMGPKTIRALALISDLIYGEPPSWEDPVKFSFSHGGKDGIPYPVDKKTYDKSIEILERGIEEAKLGKKEKLNAIKRLENFIKT